jgi:LysM repeat protein
MLPNLTFKTPKFQMTAAPAAATKAPMPKPLSSSIAILMGFALLTFGLQARAAELPKTSNGLAQFAQSANKNTKPKPFVPPEAPKPRALPEGSPLNQPAQGVDAIASMLGTQPLRTPQIKPYQPPVNLTQSASVPERTAAPLVTDPSRINLERAVEKAFAAERQPELGGYKPVPEPLRTQAEPQPKLTPRYQPAVKQPVKPVVRPKVAQPTQTYRVVSGDSLSSLSARSGVSISDLAELNNLSSTAGLLRGQSLRFPQGSLPAEPKKPKTQPSAQPNPTISAASDNLIDYQVAAGDGLIALAKRFDMSTADLAKLNNLAPTADLYVGQTLKVPAGAAPNPETYQVKRGDTLTGVAAQFGLSVSELTGYNDLSANANLRVAQTLKLTGSSSDSSAATARTKTAPASADLKNPSTYQVRSGDSLIQLARRFNLSTEALAEANGLSSRDQLQIGQTLKVPSLTQSYKVRSGDSLIALSKQYDISVQELAELNKLSSTAMLQIGQTLQVPAP